MANKNNSKRQNNKKNEKLNPSEAIGRGIALVENGDRQAAFDIFQETAELNPDMAEAWVWLGGTSSSIDAAELAFERASSLDPQNEEASLGLRWVSLQRAATAQFAPDAPAPVEEVATSTVEAAPASTSLVLLPEPAARTAACPNCGAENSLTEKFCVRCGQDLSAAVMQDKAASAPAGRRLDKRLIAAIFVVTVLLAAFIIWYMVTPH